MDLELPDCALAPPAAPLIVGCEAVLAALSVPAFLHRGGRLLCGNEALARLLGYSEAQFPAMEHDVLAQPEMREAMRAYGLACLENDAVPAATEMTLRTADGQVRFVELTARRIEVAGAPAVLSTCQDLSDIRHVQTSLLNMSQVLNQILDSDPVATFVVDAEHRVTHWNRACQHLTGRDFWDMQGVVDKGPVFYGTSRPLLCDLIVDGAGAQALHELYGGTLRESRVCDGAYEAEAFFPNFGDGGLWLFFTAAPLRDATGRIVGAIETLQDVSQRRSAEEELMRHRNQLEALVSERTVELRGAHQALESNYERLKETNHRLEEAQNQLLQSEKMASIGQLAAGVAHEINNPIGFVNSNLNSLKRYVDDLLGLVAGYEGTEAELGAESRARLLASKREVELEYMREDLPVLIRESADGLGRVKRIVQDLKDFSRVDNADWAEADLNAGLDSTLNVVFNEVKYKAEVIKRYESLPLVRCLAAQLNQVFLNLIVNAAHAIESRGTITLSTGQAEEWVWVEVADTGCGMSAEVQNRIFEPFYTTKPVGKGTGLGLSLSFSIVQKHNGVIRVDSEPGKGSAFRVWIPVNAEGPEAVPALPAQAQAR